MEKNPLSTLAKVAAIIACIVAVLTYFNIQPSCTPQNIVNYYEEIKTLHEEKNDPQESLTEYVTWKNMTTWDRVLLPFIKHKKMNYFKRECDEYGWKVIAVYGCFLLVMLYCVFGIVVPIGERFKNGNAGIGSALGALIVVLFAIYMITRIFVIFGVY